MKKSRWRGVIQKGKTVLIDVYFSHVVFGTTVLTSARAVTYDSEEDSLER